MMDIRKLAFVGLASLGLFTIGSVGCSSSNGSGTGGSSGTGTGGSNTTGTGGSHTGGSNGNGGTSSSGTGGAGGGTATVGCQMSDPPASADIATFSSTDGGGLTIMGGYYVYGSATPTPTYTPGTGSVNVTDVVQLGAANNYQGFGIYFNGNTAGTDCIDAHTYTGVQFDLSGSLMGAGCTIQFAITDSAHSDSTVYKTKGDPTSGPNDPKASGPMGAYSPQLAIPATDFTSTPMTIKVPFTTPTGGNPAITTTPLDPTKLEGVQWQMTTPAMSDGGATECNLNMTLANIKFY